VVELAQTAAKGRHAMNEALPAVGPLSGVLWTWVVPIILFSIAFAATWLLYRHFANRNDDT
jgi:hypothetical protein